MNPGTKLALYGLVLVAALGGGAAVGTVAGPVDVGRSDGHGRAHEQPDEPAAGPLPASGLLVAQDGYRFEPDDRLADAGPFSFTIVGPDGRPVVDYDELHDRELHLIVASRDLRQYAHLHPSRDVAGRWTVDLPTLPPGAYRAFADFRPRGADQYTLGVDLSVAGEAPPAGDLRPRATDSVDGFDLTLDRAPDGDEVTITVRRAGEVVVTEPYLGAAGHLVALRDGDLAYLHVHPLATDGPGPVRFAVDVPSAGTYALFFDFQVDGVVRTGRFVVDVTPTVAGAPDHAPDHADEH